MTYHDRVLQAVQQVHPVPSDPESLRARLQGGSDPEEVLCLAAAFHPGLTAWLIGVANSAPLACPVEVHSLSATLARIGAQRLASALQSHVLDGGRSGERWVPMDYQQPAWRAALLLGLAAEELARTSGLVAPSDAYTAALCADLSVCGGEFCQNPWTQDGGDAWEEGRASLTTEEHERSALGLEDWGWPKRLVAAVRWQGRPDLCPAEFRSLADHLAIARHLAGCIGCLHALPSAPWEVHGASLQRLFLQEDDFEDLMETIEVRWRNIVGAFAAQAA